MKTKVLIGLFCSALLTLSTMSNALAQTQKPVNIKNQNKNCPVKDSTCQHQQNCPTNNQCPQTCPSPSKCNPQVNPDIKNQNGNCNSCPSNTTKNIKPNTKPSEQKK